MADKKTIMAKCYVTVFTYKHVLNFLVKVDLIRSVRVPQSLIKQRTMAQCIPCIVIPLLLYFFHRFIQPYLLRIWNPWETRKKTVDESNNGEVVNESNNGEVVNESKTSQGNASVSKCPVGQICFRNLIDKKAR